MDLPNLKIQRRVGTHLLLRSDVTQRCEGPGSYKARKFTFAHDFQAPSLPTVPVPSPL
jgi:hypothetical protein